MITLDLPNHAMDLMLASLSVKKNLSSGVEGHATDLAYRPKRDDADLSQQETDRGKHVGPPSENQASPAQSIKRSADNAAQAGESSVMVRSSR